MNRIHPLLRSGSLAPALAPALAAAILLAGVPEAFGQSLNGSPASLDLQNRQARAHDFSILRTPQQVRDFVTSGYLVPVVANADLELHLVSFPYARPEVRVFLERLGSQYRAACGEKMVVTSLTRPTSNQPPNASIRSVHPTGMAVDLRRPANARCRQWLESTLLSLEASGVLDATYERNPPHYHVAVFPQPYANYLAQRTENAALLIQAARNSGGETRVVTHVVSRGETLSGLANRYNVSISRIRTENGLRGDRLLVGQSIKIPAYEQAPPAVASASSAVPDVAVTSASTGAPPAPAVSTAAVSAVVEDSGSGSETRALTHRVVRGESLWTIARLYGLTESELRAANGISGSRILVGQSLRIPGAVAPGETIPYRVQRGDSLWIIASRVGSSVDEILRVNQLASSRIYAGQVIDVPVYR